MQPSPAAERSEANWRPILAGVALVVVVVGAAAFFLRTPPSKPVAPPPYAANLKFSDTKMSAAENFVGASVTYLDGTLANSGPQTVTRVVVHVVFRNSLAEVVQTEDLPVRLLKTTGPYPEAVDMASDPLHPGQSAAFRLTFEHVSSDWNHEYPEIQISDIATR